MDVPKKKVTAKLTPPEHAAAASSTVPIRPKVSGAARMHTRTISVVSALPSQALPNGALRPISASVMARRSPSPSKMLQPAPPARTPVSKVSQVGERTRHGSVSSVSLLTSQNSSSILPTLARQPSGDSLYSTPQSSLRVKAKVSELAKAKTSSVASTLMVGIPPSLSAVVSPPSPQARAPTTISHQRSPSQHSINASPAQLVPLPTSPPASILSFSSHSSISASSQSHATSLSTTPLSSVIHASTDRAPMSALSEDIDASPVSPKSPPFSLPPQRDSVVRVRPGTRISGGRSSVFGSMSFLRGSSVSATDENASDAADTEDDEEGDIREQPRAKKEHTLDEVRAEAKSNRKIADLEITTRSLLAINASLEAAKARQTRELRELRRRLRETKLVLPPKTFRQLGDKDYPPSVESDDEENDEYDGDEDETLTRMCALVEALLDAGRKALAVACPTQRLVGLDRDAVNGDKGEEAEMGRPEVLGWDSGGKHGVAIGSKVLSPEEVDWWTGEREEGVALERNDTPMGTISEENRNTNLEYNGD